MESVAIEYRKKIQAINHCKSIQKSKQGILVDKYTKERRSLYHLLQMMKHLKKREAREFVFIVVKKDT